MSLTPEQLDAVRAWVAEGDSLSEVQKKLRSEFNLQMTFFDVRMLVMDIGATLKDREAQVEADDVTKAKLPPKPGAEEQKPIPTGAVGITVDTIQVIPGALVSGGVTFSDGEKGKWFFDQMGRFNFEPNTIGYKPSAEDARTFQQMLQQELSTRGY
ncbi:MAG: hypothetical protein Q4C03_00505 [bacterium]|nr:hypothetical protein [bacterium]